MASVNNLCFIARQIEGFNDYDFRIAECTGRCLLILRRIEIALQYLLPDCLGYLHSDTVYCCRHITSAPKRMIVLIDN